MFTGSHASIAGINAVIGSVLGAKLNLILSAKYLQIIMVLLLPCSGLHPCQQKLRRRKQDGHPFQKTACNPGGTHWSDIRCLHRFLRCRRRCIYFACFTTLTKLDLITASGNTKDNDGK
mgnify:CR=1 FL=1